MPVKKISVRLRRTYSFAKHGKEISERSFDGNNSSWRPRGLQGSPRSTQTSEAGKINNKDFFLDFYTLSK